MNSVNTTLGSGNTLKLDLNEDLTRDLLITTGTMTWGGTLALNLTNTGTLANGSSWDFFNGPVLGDTGAFAGDLNGITLTASSIYNGLTFTTATSGNQYEDKGDSHQNWAGGMFLPRPILDRTLAFVGE